MCFIVDAAMQRRGSVLSNFFTMNIHNNIARHRASEGIATMLTVEIQRMREAGRVDEDAVNSFSHDLREEIYQFRKAVAQAKLSAAHTDEFQVLIHQELTVLLEAAGSLYGQVPVADLHVLPEALDHRLYYHAWQKVCKLTDEIHIHYCADLRAPVDLPGNYQAIAQYEFGEQLDAVVCELRKKGASDAVIETLMYPFHEFQSPGPGGLIHRDLVNLRRLKTDMQKCNERRAASIEHALQSLLYRLNVNTLESIQYCTAHLRAALDGAGSAVAKREVLARWQRDLSQTAVEQNIFFAPWLDTLVDRMLEVITSERTYLSASPAEAAAHLDEVYAGKPTNTSGSVTLKIPNGHYAAYMRVKQETGFFTGTQKDIILHTEGLFPSNKNKTLGRAAYEDYYKKPTTPAVWAAWHLHWKGIHWMIKQWKAYGIPNPKEMNPHDFKKYFLELETSFP